MKSSQKISGLNLVAVLMLLMPLAGLALLCSDWLPFGLRCRDSLTAFKV